MTVMSPNWYLKELESILHKGSPKSNSHSAPNTESKVVPDSPQCNPKLKSTSSILLKYCLASTTQAQESSDAPYRKNLHTWGNASVRYELQCH